MANRAVRVTIYRTKKGLSRYFAESCLVGDDTGVCDNMTKDEAVAIIDSVNRAVADVNKTKLLEDLK